MPQQACTLQIMYFLSGFKVIYIINWTLRESSCCNYTNTAQRKLNKTYKRDSH